MSVDIQYKLETSISLFQGKLLFKICSVFISVAQSQKKKFEKL